MVVLVRVLSSLTGFKCPDLPVTIVVDGELWNICITLDRTSVKKAKLWKKAVRSSSGTSAHASSVVWLHIEALVLSLPHCCRSLVTVTTPAPLLLFGHCGTAPLITVGAALLSLLAPSSLAFLEQPAHAAAFPCTQGDFNNVHPCNKVVVFPSLLFHCLFLLEKELNENFIFFCS